MNIFLWLAFTAVGFLSGSIMFCRIIPALITHKDICAISDDRNPGAFNVFRHCGKKIGALCLFLDILKAFAPVILAGYFLDTDSILFAFVIASPVLGHAVGLFGGRGGKCISASFGAAAGLIPVTCLPFLLLAGIYVLFSGIVRIRPNRKCSIVVYACFASVCAVVLNLLGYYSVALGCGIISATAIVKHLNFRLRRSEVNENAVD